MATLSANVQKPAVAKASNGVSLAATSVQPAGSQKPSPTPIINKPVVVRSARFPDSARIIVKTDKETNPKRPGTAAHKAFGMYLSTKAKLDAEKKPLTVAAFREALMASGQPLRYVTSTLDWDSKHGFIEVVSA